MSVAWTPLYQTGRHSSVMQLYVLAFMDTHFAEVWSSSEVTWNVFVCCFGLCMTCDADLRGRVLVCYKDVGYSHHSVILADAGGGDSGGGMTLML